MSVLKALHKLTKLKRRWYDLAYQNNDYIYIETKHIINRTGHRIQRLDFRRWSKHNYNQICTPGRCQLAPGHFGMGSCNILLTIRDTRGRYAIFLSLCGSGKLLLAAVRQVLDFILKASNATNEERKSVCHHQKTILIIGKICRES